MGTRRRGIATSMVLALWSTLPGSRALADSEGERRPVELVYRVAPGVEGCPDEASLRSAVSARLGYEPWDEKADRILRGEVNRRGRALVGRIELRNRRGKLLGKRELTSRGHDCTDLAASMELAISIAIDPLSITRPRPTSAPASSPAPKQAEPPRVIIVQARPPPPRTPPAPPGPPWSLSASVGGLLALGSAPSVAGGFAVQVRLRRGLLSIGVEGRFDLPAYQDVTGGKISGSIMGGAILPCAHFNAFSGCVNVTVGALRAAGHDLVAAENVTMAYLATGLRLGAEIPLVSIVSLRLYGDLLATCTRISLKETDSGKVYWTTPPVSGALGLGFAGSFL